MTVAPPTPGVEELSDVVSDLTREAAHRKDDAILQEIDENDWDKHPVIDIVWVRATPQVRKWEQDDTFVANLGYARTFKYGRRAPDIGKRKVYGKVNEVFRVTRPLVEKFREEGRL